MSFVNTKTVILIVAIIILILIIRNIVDSIVSLRQNSNIVTTLRQEEREQVQKKQFLKEKLHLVNTSQFIENEAREKLGMIKPGEHIVLAPPVIVATQKPSEIDYSPNWQKWWKLFF